MEFHPYADLFPMLPEEELQTMADDIRENGQRHKIIVDADDRIVDGRNRYRACELAGVEPEFEARDFDDREALAFVVSANLKRRHLTPSQRAAIAASIANLPAHRPGKSATLQTSDPPVSQAEAAEIMGVSERSVATAVKVRKKGAPELQQAVTDGKVSVSCAAKLVDRPVAVQRAAVRSKPSRKGGARRITEPPLVEATRESRFPHIAVLDISEWPENQRRKAFKWLCGVRDSVQSTTLRREQKQVLFWSLAEFANRFSPQAETACVDDELPVSDTTDDAPSIVRFPTADPAV